jgi:ribonucleotide reductase beta subunit family protein with ferritin-like domain
MYRLIFIVFLALLFGCSSQHKLQNTYVGKRQKMLESKFGYPKTILDQGDEKVYVYEIIKDLKSTEINQGRLSLDPMISPMVQKTERYYFYVKDSIITNVKLDEEYDR